MGTEEPTTQDIEQARAVVGSAVLNVARSCVDLGNPRILTNSVARWLPVFRVLDYAAERLRAEEEGERGPEDAGGAGTPVWHPCGDVWGASVSEGDPDFQLTASFRSWTRYGGEHGHDYADSGLAPNLAANIRAATASWNAAHPDLPPVVVPEQFRESEDGPEVEDGYYRVIGDIGGNKEHVRIKTHPECGPAVWGLSLWGPEGERPTWKYRTLGISLESFRERWPEAFLVPDRDRVKEREQSVPEVEAPEDADEYPCAAGCGEVLGPPFAPGDTCWSCDAVEKPPTDPEARVGAMSDEEVEAALTGRGVGPWDLVAPHRNLHDRDWINPSRFVAIDAMGGIVSAAGERLSREPGDTTTPEGRAECSRRLLVHLLREEENDG